jgi:Family of unknown function (DUF6445)
MYQSVIILDEFYQDAERIREMALGLEYPDHGGKAYYSGRNSKHALINQGIVDTLSKVVCDRLTPAPKSATGHFRIGLAGDMPRQDIHIDPYRDWAGVVYFSRPEDCRGGTTFWRHKRLGIEAMPNDQKAVEGFGYKDYEEMRNRIADEDGVDRSKWEPTMTVPMRFNRCLMFRSWLWHSHAENFGDTIENGRLIQVFFFDIVRGAEAPKLWFDMPPAPATEPAPVAARPVGRPTIPIPGSALASPPPKRGR